MDVQIPAGVAYLKREGMFVSMCCTCPNAREDTATLRALGFTTSHGLCRQHTDEWLARADAYHAEQKRKKVA